MSILGVGGPETPIDVGGWTWILSSSRHRSRREDPGEEWRAWEQGEG